MWIFLFCFVILIGFGLQIKKKTKECEYFVTHVFKSVYVFQTCRQVGFFGYVTFYSQEIPGDILAIFPSTLFADMMKLCFVFSIVITFPVIIFPCRASIYTLLFSKVTMNIAKELNEIAFNLLLFGTLCNMISMDFGRVNDSFAHLLFHRLINGLVL